MAGTLSAFLDVLFALLLGAYSAQVLLRRYLSLRPPSRHL